MHCASSPRCNRLFRIHSQQGVALAEAKQGVALLQALAAEAAERDAFRRNIACTSSTHVVDRGASRCMGANLGPTSP